MSKTALLMFPIFALSYVLAPEIVTVLFTEAYLDGTDIFRMYLLLMPLRLCIYGGILRALGDTQYFMKVMLGVTALNVVGNFALFQWIGWTGPALSSVLTHALTVILLIRYAGRLLGRPSLSLFPWMWLLRVAIVAGLSVIPLFFIPLDASSAGVRLGIGLGVYVFGYLALGLLSRTLRMDDLRYLVTMFRKKA